MALQDGGVELSNGFTVEFLPADFGSSGTELVVAVTVCAVHWSLCASSSAAVCGWAWVEACRVFLTADTAGRFSGLAQGSWLPH